MWLDPALAPFSRWTDAVLLAARLIMGVVMLYYGWPKIRDPRKNAKDFDATGFRPGWLFGTLVLASSSAGSWCSSASTCGLPRRPSASK